MKRITLWVVLLFVGVSSFAQNSRSFSLNEAVSYAQNNSIKIKDAQIAVSDADWRVEEAKAIGFPQVNFKSDYNRFLKLPVTILPQEFGIDPTTGMVDPNFNPEVTFGVKHNFGMSLEASALLFDGSYIIGLRAARQFTSQVRKQLVAERDAVRNDVRDAYLPALIIDENVKILEKNIENLETLRFETNELYQAGFVEQLDVDRLDLSIANLKAEMDNLSRSRRLVENALKYQMGYPVTQKIVLSDDLNALLIEATQEDLEGRIDYTNRSEYAILQSAIELNELNVQSFKAGYLPQLVAFGSYGINWQGDDIPTSTWNDNAVVGLQLNVPIFDGFRKRASIQRANLQLEQVRNRVKTLERTIELQVENARQDYKNAKNRLADRQKNVDLAEKIYRTARIKYKEGVGSSLEITQAEQSLFQAQANLTSAKYDLLVAKFALDKAIGK